MKILHVSMEYDYGDVARGRGYEYYNFYLCLKEAGYEIELFDYMKHIEQHGKTKMNSMLIEKVYEFKPDFVLVSLYTDQFEYKTFEVIQQSTFTFCFFHDDTWRIEYTRTWAQYFDLFSSPDYYCKYIYPQIGLNNFYYFPFGVNSLLYHPIEKHCNQDEKKYDISFVGGYNAYRGWLIKRIRKAGYRVEAFGYGWPNGVLKHSEMIEVFNSSKINLNLSNSFSWDVRYLSSGFRSIVNLIRSKKGGEQLKARIFEINACNAFQLSYYVDGLEHCYEIGEEIGVYLTPDDLLKKIKFYIERPLLRESIAQKGYHRTMKDHTYIERFKSLFEYVSPRSKICSQ